MANLPESNNPDIVFGVAEVKADGDLIAKISDVAFTPAGVQYEDDNNGTCFIPSLVGATLKYKSRLCKGQSLENINKKNDVTITIRANTGQVWMMPHAVKMKPSEISSTPYDGEFHSSESEEIKNG